MINKIIRQALLGIFLISTTLVNAQVLNVSNETIIYDGKERSAVKVTIAPNAKEIKKSFKDFMDDQYKVDVEGIGFLKNKDVVYTEPAVISAISTKPMELFVKVMENGSKTNMYVFGQIGYNNQITPTSNWVEYTAMKDLTVNFLDKLLPNYYQDIVEDQKEEVADLEDDRDDMRKKMDKNKDKIAKLQKENEELERKIAATKVRLEQGMEALGEKKATLKQVNTKLDKVNKQ